MRGGVGICRVNQNSPCPATHFGQPREQLHEACLAPVPALAGDEIRAIREREHVSQPVFAAYLNVSPKLSSP